jgi:hypothetical protein
MALLSSEFSKWLDISGNGLFEVDVFHEIWHQWISFLGVLSKRKLPSSLTGVN